MLLSGHPSEVKWYEWHFWTDRDFCDMGQQADLSTKIFLITRRCWQLKMFWHGLKIFPIRADLCHINIFLDDPIIDILKTICLIKSAHPTEFKVLWVTRDIHTHRGIEKIQSEAYKRIMKVNTVSCSILFIKHCTMRKKDELSF